ncbi:MAG: iron dicitrate transport regulator FecR [Dyadobacter sp. 50-39]|uniref:FecR family protein n=1 Tax=Dyadobacter sp. 50-39 TaxID=1895756 RepID=UPI00095C7674|nr:FecR domain-containing protein [Dyadobacter sp. 50-39]OJV22668.1 MAG: iron dicitrate transport regulator FecR [Dyadobacter sp. 50-39]
MKKSLLSKQVIQNFFEGKTTQMQNILIQEWLENPVNRELYFQWLDEWETENPQFTPDVEQGYRRSLYTVQTDAPSPMSARANTGGWQRRLFVIRWAAAASVALLLTGYLLSDFWLYKQYETGYGEVRTVVLPDSSRVTLNANSVLSIPRFGFGSGTREVLLKGEAEFAVKHTVDHSKFVVRTPDKLEVKVLGTEFIVYSRERGSKVVLSQGSVQLRALNKLNSKPMLMKPGDVATMSTQGTLTLKHSESLLTHQAWKQRRFMFENTPVSEIAYQISEHFGVNVVVADSTLARRTIGGTFNANDPAHVLKVLSDVLNARVTHTPPGEDGAETFVLDSDHL